jgi:hypothetical protein
MLALFVKAFSMAVRVAAASKMEVQL